MSFQQAINLNVPPGSSPPTAQNIITPYYQILATGLPIPVGVFNNLSLHNIGTRCLVLCVSNVLGSLSQGLTFFIRGQQNFHLDAPGYDTLTLWDVATGLTNCPIMLPISYVFGLTPPPNGGYVLINTSSSQFNPVFNEGKTPWCVLASTVTNSLATGFHTDLTVDTCGATDVLLLYGLSGNSGSLTASAFTTDPSTGAVNNLWTGLAITGTGNFSEMIGQDNPNAPLGNNLTFRVSQTGAGPALVVTQTILAR